jgi:hypothetical protein
MNFSQAMEAAEIFRAIGGFTKVEVEHPGFYSRQTPEIENDGTWRVNLWCVNAKAGNKTVEFVTDAVTEKSAKLIAKVAKGKATDRDRAALSRMAAERAVNQE